MSKIIRRATLDDLDALGALFDAYRVFYEQSSDITAARAFMKNRLERDEIISYLALMGDTPQGFANIYPSYSSVAMAPIWVLNDLYVAKEARRTGIANTLMTHISTDARAQNVIRLSLETAADNTGAQKCYEGFGWRKNNCFFYDLTIERP